MGRYIFLFAIIAAISIQQPLLAQQVKEEVEQSIHMGEMPKIALEALEEFMEDEVIRDLEFYRETDGETTTFEAKFNWQNYLYSIEFSESGNLLDIEQLIEFSELPEQIQQQITATLEEQYSRYRITRIQRQYISNEKDEDADDILEDLIEREFEDFLIHYEIETDGQNRREMGSFEMLFDSDGELIQKRRIIRRSIDNIW